MKSIKIIEDHTLSEHSGKISKNTWQSIKKSKGSGAFFPEENHILVGNNPFDPQYILEVVNDDLEKDVLYVSPDIKRSLYKDTDILSC